MSNNQNQQSESAFNVTLFSIHVKASIGGKTLREVSEEIGISITTLSRMTKGNMPDVETFFKLCEWMNIIPSYFSNIPNPELGSIDLLGIIKASILSTSSLDDEGKEVVTNLVDYVGKLIEKRKNN